MSPKFEFNLIKVENTTTHVSCSHGPAVDQGHTQAAPSRNGWLVWTKRTAKLLWFLGRACWALHGGDVDLAELLQLGSSIALETMTWIKERFKK